MPVLTSVVLFAGLGACTTVDSSSNPTTRGTGLDANLSTTGDGFSATIR